MIARRMLLALMFTALLAIPTITRAQAIEEEQLQRAATVGGGLIEVLDLIKQAQAQRLEGSWALNVTPALPPGAPAVPAFRTYLTVSRGGALIGSDRTRPFGSPQHGAWAHLGSNEFAATLVQDEFNALGVFIGTLTVRQKITLTGNDQFVGVANAEVRDAAGTIMLSRCATTRGERIKVELLAPQCQTITPPQ